MTDPLRERHQPADTIPGEVCDECGDPWPCLVIQAADERDTEKRTAESLANEAREAENAAAVYKAERDAARADADRLRVVVDAARVWANAYGDRWQSMMGGEHVDPRIEADATRALYAALRAHDEATR